MHYYQETLHDDLVWSHFNDNFEQVKLQHRFKNAMVCTKTKSTTTITKTILCIYLVTSSKVYFIFNAVDQQT